MIEKIGVSLTVENGIHFLVFPARIAHSEYDDVFTQAYALVGDLTGIRVILDLSQLDHINSWFIGIIAEFYSNIEEHRGRMVILANTAIDDIFWFVGFKDFVDIVLDREEAIRVLHGLK